MMADTVLSLIGPIRTDGFGFSTVFLLIILFISILTAIHVYFTSQESYKLGLELPGPYPLPILGNALLALTDTQNST